MHARILLTCAAHPGARAAQAPFLPSSPRRRAPPCATYASPSPRKSSFSAAFTGSFSGLDSSRRAQPAAAAVGGLGWACICQSALACAVVQCAWQCGRRGAVGGSSARSQSMHGKVAPSPRCKDMDKRKQARTGRCGGAWHACNQPHLDSCWWGMPACPLGVSCTDPMPLRLSLRRLLLQASCQLKSKLKSLQVTHSMCLDKTGWAPWGLVPYSQETPCVHCFSTQGPF